jgi:hypothetical protein
VRQIVGKKLGSLQAAEALDPRPTEEVVDNAGLILQQRRDLLYAPRHETDPELGQPFSLGADRCVQLRRLQVERGGEMERRRPLGPFALK